MTPKQPPYQPGLGNEFETEALAGALPVGRNSPQRCPYGLYAEQISGTAFTAPRALNRRTWCYRIRPSVKRGAHFRHVDVPLWRSAPEPNVSTLPLAAERWDPAEVPAGVGFVDGMRTMTTAGDLHSHTGMSAHVYNLSTSTTTAYFCNADGELLLLPELGGISLCTELGTLHVAPGEIALVPRGIVFRVEAHDAIARGYVCENYGVALGLPELGPIGANGLASARDFLSPVAAYEDDDSECELTMKWGGRFFAATLDHCPLDVVAWHGNYAPCKYDLARFSPVGSIGFDHPDPSIFTVLTSPSGTPGTANIDFVIFPPRWMVAEDTFRPPWYHRNVMSEFMGLIHGVYDAKPEGFIPGGMSLHNCLLPHGPDADAFEAASTAELAPVKLGNTLAFMFESRLAQHVTRYAAESPTRQAGYADCWAPITRHFDPAKR